MFVVLFEVHPRADRWDDYMQHAGVLRPELSQIDGFLDNRRFASRGRPGWLLSLSLWRDEKSVVRWRTHAGHHAIQVAGRQEIFHDYHLRVGEIVRDNGVISPQQRLDATETGLAKAVSVLDMPDDDAPVTATGLIAWEMYDGITVPDTRLALLSWRDEAAMTAWNCEAGHQGSGAARRLDARIVRDYGLHARAEAPQYHALVRSRSAPV